MKYCKRLIDSKLLEWKESASRKPLLVRGARQVGKSSSIREFGKTFKYFVEVNLEKQPSFKSLFSADIDVKKTCEKLEVLLSKPIVPGETLLFIDEIQCSQEAIMSLRYFKEDFPELHVVAAGSLLEFALEELPSFAVGRIRSLYLYPFSFDEFLMALREDALLAYRNSAGANEPLAEPIHNKLVDLLKTFYLIGGMPAAVSEWVEKHDYLECARIHNEILDSYQDDFSKYKKRANPVLLRQVLKSVGLQAGGKFVCSRVSPDYTSAAVKDALRLLHLAGLIYPVSHSDANGLPLGAEEKSSFTKYLFFDLGIMQTMLSTPAAETLLSSNVDFVNKGPASEMFAGLELLKYADCLVKSTLHYWQNQGKNTNAKVDYLIAKDSAVFPIEIKASVSGGMQSLWIFMRKKHLQNAARCSLENFGQLKYVDSQDGGAERCVQILPLYALSMVRKG